MKNYTVYYERKVSPGRTFYKGERTVSAEDRDDAFDKVWNYLKGSFREDTKSSWYFELKDEWPPLRIFASGSKSHEPSRQLIFIGLLKYFKGEIKMEMENALIGVPQNLWKEIAKDIGIDLNTIKSIKKEKNKPYLHIEDLSFSSVFYYPFNLGLDDSPR